jgi:K+-transporting ATPase ATPase C chain
VKTVVQALKIFIIMTVLTGIIYPLVITLIGQGLFPSKANGSLIIRDNKVIGSNLIGQKFASNKYFWPRPSAVDYNPLPSGATNLGPTSADLAAKVSERRGLLLAANPGSYTIPSDLVFASASGLDPNISPQAARFQIARISRARGLDNNQEKMLIDLVEKNIQPPTYEILGEYRINVLQLNTALDSVFVGTNP